MSVERSGWELGACLQVVKMAFCFLHNILQRDIDGIFALIIFASTIQNIHNIIK